MITRVFRARIDPDLREEWEAKFTDVSVKVVENQPGFVSVWIGRPTAWAPDEYVMISQWEDQAALEDWLGQQWNQAFIPHGMESFIRECWVHHYESFE